jgi:hypothetical protein
MKRKRIRWALLALLLLLLLLLGLGARKRVQASRQEAKVKELRGRLTGEAGRKLSPDQRREAWRQLRRETEKLSPRQRKALAAGRRKAFRDRLGRFFKLPPKERLAELDRDIQRLEEARRRWQASRASGAGGPGQAWGAGPAGGGGPGGRGRGRAMSWEDRQRMRKQRLDDSTPEERAQRAEYFRLLQQRRQQLGLGGGFPWGPR